MSRARRSLLAAAVLAAASVPYVAEVARDAHFQAPTPTPVVLDRDGAFITQAGHHDGSRVDYGYWMTPPPPRVAAATVALEDRRFRWHPGVDPIAIARAVWTGHSGASTIAMQVARMQHPRPRTLWAKALEAGTAVALTLRYGHDAVLAQYLRLAPYGDSSHGIGHAARWYFDRPAADLSWAQAALLAAVPQSPARLALRRAGVAAIPRAARALALLGQTDALRDLATTHPVSRPVRPSSALPLALRLERIAPGGAEPLLHATVDLALQSRVQVATDAHVRAWRADGAQQAAVIVVRRHTNEVLAAIAAVPGPGSAIDFTAADRSPGSTLKPFLYALAFDRALLAPSDILADQPEGAAGIRNADNAFLGPLLPRQALANSRNVPATDLLRRIGLQPAFTYLHTLGLHHLEGSAERFGLAMALGALPTSLDRLVAAYATLAEDGAAQPLQWFAGQDREPPRRLMTASTARLITRALSDPMARLPSFPRYGSSEFPFAVALKTGTSQGYRDAWTVAWSDRYLIGVWVGRPDGGPMAGLSGARAAGSLAQAIVLQLHGRTRTDLLAGDFQAPAGWRQAELCTDTGQATADCPGRLLEFLPPTTPPRHAASLALQITQPEPDTHLWRNPDLPPSLNLLVLRAAAGPGIDQVVWLVDDVPALTAAPGTPFTWPLTPGRHRFQLRLPLADETSRPLTVTVD